jgi:tetratricopeptide (TPR) repeat protein
MKLFPTGDERGLAVAPDLVFALWEFGEVDEALGVLAQARLASDASVDAMAEILELTIDLMNKGEVRADERAARRDTARAVLEAASHDQGLALYWWSTALDMWLRCRAAETAAACQRSIAYSLRAGTGAMSNDLQTWMRSAYVHGPTPVADAIEHLEAELLATDEGNLVFTAGLRASLSSLHAMRGEIDQARELRRRSKQTYRDAGMTLTAASAALGEAWVEQHAGDLGSCERVLRSALDELELLGDRAFHATVATALARCLCAQGRYDEVRDLCARARASTAPEDLVNFVSIDSLEARLLARSGSQTNAEARARRAVELAATTDFWSLRGNAYLDLAEVLVHAPRLDEARGVAARGLEFYESKGDETGAARAREHLERLGIALP